MDEIEMRLAAAETAIIELAAAQDPDKLRAAMKRLVNDGAGPDADANAIRKGAIELLGHGLERAGKS